MILRKPGAKTHARRRAALACAFIGLGVGVPAEAAERDSPEITRITPEELRRLDQHRSLVKTLARRYAGSQIAGGSLQDLRALQILVDRAGTRDRRLMDFAEPSFSDRDQIYELQSIGVVLGDVIAKQLSLVWVIIDDEYGRGRALLHEATGYRVFPVTMVSKRYEKGIRSDVHALYEQVAESVRAADAENRRSKRRTNPPRRVSGSGK